MTRTTKSNIDVARYYDSSQFYYTHFWSQTALHYGLWYADTHDLAEAVANTDKLVIDTLAVGCDDVVLDAGCGVGGTSIAVAERTGARVEGITLSSVQLRIAHLAAARSRAASALAFSIQDFTKTDFTGGMFSRVYGIESICYAFDKRDFLREAYRVLRGAGRIAIVDTFLTERTFSSRDTRITELFLEGWVVPNLSRRESFRELLSDAGFQNIVFVDLQEYIWPSVRRVFRCGLITAPANLLKSFVGIGRRNVSALYQKPLFERGIATYGMFVADKPERI